MRRPPSPFSLRTLVHTLPHRLLPLGAVVALAVASCKSPLEGDGDEALRESVMRSYTRDLAAGQAADGGQPGERISVAGDTTTVAPKLEGDRLKQTMAQTNFQELDLQPGPDLLGRGDTPIVRVSLDEAVKSAVEHNLDYRVARLTPAIARARLEQAEAAFDLLFFAEGNWSKIDQPRAAAPFTGGIGDPATPTNPTNPTSPLGTAIGGQQQEVLELIAGVQKPFRWGGSLALQTSMRYVDQSPSFFSAGEYYTGNAMLTLRAPLLRGLGRDINESEIALARNAAQSETAGLRTNLLSLALQTTQAYWELYAARQAVLIQQQLLNRTLEDVATLERRAIRDANPVQVTESRSFAALRQADLVQARQRLRLASDRLKRLMNDPDLPLAGETLLLPVDDPARAAFEFSLLDSVLTALRQRPELQQALLNISDARIRLRVADNALLPLLDFTAGIGATGLDEDNPGDAYGELVELDYIDYLLGLRLERSFSNNAAEAAYRGAQLQRQQAILNYRRVAQQSVLEVKSALREVATNYQLIEAASDARLAAADNLRAINQQQDLAGLTPEFINLKLDAQSRLAQAELREAQSLADYNSAIAQLYERTGTLLDQMGIRFQDNAGNGQR